MTLKLILPKNDVFPGLALVIESAANPMLQSELKRWQPLMKPRIADKSHEWKHNDGLSLRVVHYRQTEHPHQAGATAAPAQLRLDRCDPRLPELLRIRPETSNLKRAI